MSEEVKNNVTAGPENDQNQQGQDEENNQTEEEVERIELTKEEYEAEKQKEADRRVTEALKKREKEFEKQLKKEKEEARREAEELAKLSEEEKLKVQKEKEEMELTKERETLEKERAEFERERLLLQAEKELSNRKIPQEFAPYILGSDADDTFERIGIFEEQWQKAIEAEVAERLKGKTPRFGGKPLSEIDQLQKQLEDPNISLQEKVSVKNRLHALQKKE